MVKIEFFRDGESLGSFPLKDHSNDIDRDEVAEVNQVGDYDHFTLDDGRTGASRWDGGYYLDSKGKLWLIENT